MKIPTKRLLSVGLISGVFQILPAADSNDVENIIATARQYLGREERINAIRTIQYIGRFEAPSDGSSGHIQIILSRPMKQRQVVEKGDDLVVTVVDDYDGWRSSVNLQKPDILQLEILGSKELKRLRANTFENLSFFSGIRKQHGVVISKGRVRKDGRAANLLVFRYEDDLFFERYFDVETGELIATVTDQGLEMRELGEVIVEGVRFPDRVVSLINGEVVNTIFFDEIKVNEEIDETAFEMPSFLPSKRQSAQ